MGLFDRFKKSKNVENSTDIKPKVEKEVESQSNNVSNDEKLKDIAINGTDINARKDAINKIESDSIQSEIIENVNDSEIILCAYKNIHNSFNRQQVINYIDDENLLIKILENESDNEVISRVVSKISNEDVLIDLAENNTDANIRCSAIKNPNFNNEEILKSLAYSDDDSVSLAAISKITDKEFLKEILKNKKDNYNDIVPKLTNEELLVEILNKGYNGKLETRTVYYINDEDILFDIAKAKYGKNDNMQANALAKIENQNYLEALAYNENLVICQQAVRHITDKSILENIISDSPNPRVRNLAIQCRDKL